MIPDFNKASIETHALLRILFAALTLALIGADLLTAPASADTSTWSDTESGEDIFVRACPGFAITTSYTANRTFKVISNTTGDQVVERMYVRFAGTLANDTSGQSLPYDGKLIRISDYHRNNVRISDLELRFQPDTQGQLSVAIDRLEMDLIADPIEVIKAFSSDALHAGLCDVLGSAVGPEPAVESYEERMFTGPSVESAVASYEERTFSGPATNGLSEQSVDDMTPWTILDPCDTSPPGKSC